MRKRTKTRLLVIVPVAASVLLAVGSYWLANPSSDDNSPPKTGVLGDDRPQVISADPTVAITDRPMAAGAGRDVTAGTN